MIGKILSFPFRLANVPFRAFEKIVASGSGSSDLPEGSRILSVPLDRIAEAIEEVDKP